MRSTQRILWKAATCAISIAALLSVSACASDSSTAAGSSTASSPLVTATAPKVVVTRTPAPPRSVSPSANATKTRSAPIPTAVQVARAELARLTVRPQSSMSGYKRTKFGDGWEYSNGCNTRDRILARDMRDVTYRGDTCVVATGVLVDPYGGSVINFNKAKNPSAVQIDHVVALANAWVTGAASWSEDERNQLANDPLELLAVDGSLNQAKGDDDASEWLPPRAAYRCSYVERQIAVKSQYKLWVTVAEKSAMQEVLADCA